MSDIMAELDNWLAHVALAGGGHPEIATVETPLVQRARAEIAMLRDELTMARADWNNEIRKRRDAETRYLTEREQRIMHKALRRSGRILNEGEGP